MLQAVLALVGVQFLMGVFRNPISGYNTASAQVNKEIPHFKGQRFVHVSMVC